MRQDTVAFKEVILAEIHAKNAAAYSSHRVRWNGRSAEKNGGKEKCCREPVEVVAGAVA